MNSQALNQFMNIHRQNRMGMRVGQLFISMYFKDGEAVPGLYYEENEVKAMRMIDEWLTDNCYTDKLPQLSKSWLEHEYARRDVTFRGQSQTLGNERHAP